MARPDGVTGWSTECDCGISWSYSLTFLFSFYTDQIHFIDFEVATYNYEHFEVAQHFCEYIGK